MPVEQTTECDHGSPFNACPVKGCGPELIEDDQPSFVANYGGDCRLCPFEIEPGDTIVREGYGYAHVRCPD